MPNHANDRYIVIIDFGYEGYTESRRFKWQALLLADRLALRWPDAHIIVRDNKKGKVVRDYGRIQDRGSR